MYNLASIIQSTLKNLFGSSPSLDLLYACLGYLVPCLAVVTVISMIGGILTLMERKVAGAIQNRLGPNRVGPSGSLQWIADAIKLHLKEDIIPALADKNLFRLAPYIVFVGTVLTGMVIPFGGSFIVVDLNVGLIFIIVAVSLIVIGLLMSGWASNNKWALLGGIRSAAQIVSYEIPSALALLTVILITGSFSMQTIVAEQGLFPWQWFIFYNPFTFIAFFIFSIASLAELNRVPFDFPEAESELVSGYNVEYSGMRFGFFFAAEFGNIFVTASIATAVFLGGGNIGLDPYDSGIGYQLLMVLVFFAKVIPLCFVSLWVRWTLPRLRIDQMMSMCWKYLIPISFVCLISTALWMLVFNGNGIFWRMSGS